jgi:hypothetical protein
MGRLCWFENGGCDHKIFIGVESRHTAGMNKPWRTFCRPGTSFIACRRGRGKRLIDGRDIIPVDKAQKRHWRSVAMQFVSEAENCHGAECLLRVAVRIRVPGYLLILVSDSVSCKKHDKQLTHIVRVRRSHFIKFFL